ncbi:32 kDa beta-galactoside-binding lectin-like [Spodoptera frugiperda]|uniref:Galectin n=1 Tax=Spodoptera frugiperda TaxID=7108 RepID=A0A9R0F1Z0_SPOFR|nr:32 kDa beta-galactoside-binding lectin-like [Spodoptera frugiperda]
MATIIKPKIPGAFPIPCGVAPGTCILVRGMVPPCAKRFEFNLQCGPKLYPGEDIAFHFNPRFAEKQLVRNHYECSKWGPEEVSNNSPIKAGDCLEARICCTCDSYKVEVNGKVVCEFKHRIPPGKVTHIGIEGNIIVDKIDFNGGKPPEEPKLPIPVIIPITNGMCPGRRIRINGKTPPGAKRFHVDVQCGPKVNAKEDIAFHFHVHFADNKVVRNHFAASKWGKDESDGGMPFKIGDYFEIFIHCYQDIYRVRVNGNRFCDFIHRISCDKATHVVVDGDCEVSQITFDPCDESAPPC